jgi:predicted small secreted protein
MFRLFAALGFATLMLGACNTVQGAGRDLSAAGQVVTESAAEVQDRI